MKVAMFSRMPADPDHPRGGVESATVGLLRGLAARGDIDLHVITLEKGRDADAVEETPLATVHRLATGRMPMMLDVFGGPGRRKIDRCVRDIAPDVVHFQETYGFGGPYPDIPTVFTVHGFDSLNLVTERKWLWRLRAPLWRFAEKKGIGNHRHLVSIAPYVTEELETVCDADISPIPNAISPQFFDIEPRPVPGRVLYAGWINRRKNIGAAIRAIAQLAGEGLDVSLHAAGEFSDDEYLQEVEGLLDELGVRGRVSLLGRVPQGVLRSELAEANVLILPSLQENAPMVIAEAMAAGVPVIASNVCGMPTMIDEDENGFLIEPEDIDGIAERLGSLLRDSDLQRRMSRAAVEKARNTYHPDAVVAATLALYEKVRGAYSNS
ncbi:MAG: glycosyltransferase family 4 protein [Gammaproteobacteria bacterium]|nr:glycosyltransferase family 4 protein [Gammaproteobacteria bacterium]